MRGAVISDINAAIEALDEMSLLASQRKASRLTRDERNAILALVYSVNLSPCDTELLKRHVFEHRKIEGANRSYMFRKSSEYTVMLRYIFPSVADRSNVSRWAGALCQMARIGVPPHSFAKGLVEHGPLMDLYYRDRDNVTRRQKRQTITLDRPIDVVEGCTTTLTIRPNSQMVFEVISFSLEQDEPREAV